MYETTQGHTEPFSLPTHARVTRVPGDPAGLHLPRPRAQEGPPRGTGCRGSTYTPESSERGTPGVCPHRALAEHSAELCGAGTPIEPVLKIILTKSQTKKYRWVRLLFQARAPASQPGHPTRVCKGLWLWPVPASPSRGRGWWAAAGIKLTAPSHTQRTGSLFPGGSILPYLVSEANNM